MIRTVSMTNLELWIVTVALPAMGSSLASSPDPGSHTGCATDDDRLRLGRGLLLEAFVRSLAAEASVAVCGFDVGVADAFVEHVEVKGGLELGSVEPNLGPVISVRLFLILLGQRTICENHAARQSLVGVGPGKARWRARNLRQSLSRQRAVCARRVGIQLWSCPGTAWPRHWWPGAIATASSRWRQRSGCQRQRLEPSSRGFGAGLQAVHSQ